MGTITLTSGPGVGVTGQVVQRTSQTDRQGIDLSGTYAKAAVEVVPSLIEVRVVEDPHGTEVVGWTRLRTLQWSAEGTWTGTLDVSVPTGGWYNWEYRAVDAAGNVLGSDLTDTGRWGVGVVFGLFGQSNMLDVYHDDVSVESCTEVPNDLIACYGPWNTWFKAADLQNHPINLEFFGTTWTASTKTITKVGAFASYTHTPSDTFVFFLPGTMDAVIATIASKVSNDAIMLVEEIHPTDLVNVRGAQRPRGLVALGNQLVTAFPNMPIGFIGASVDGSAIDTDGDYLSVGSWLRGSLIGYAELAADTTCVAATGEANLEGIIWLQGEAEATAPAAENFTSFVPTKGYQIEKLNALEDKLRTKIDSWRGLPVMAAQIGRYHGDRINAGGTATNPAIRSRYLTIASDISEWMAARGYGTCPLFGAETIADGIHYTPAAREEWCKRMGEQVGKWIGDVKAGSGTGPRIISARFGDEVTNAPSPTDADLQSKLHITLRVQHDQGTDLTIGTHPHVAFGVSDQYGSLYVSAVTKGPAVSAGGVQLVLLTLERDTSVTAGKDRPFDAPAELIGSFACVQYIGGATIPHEGSPLNRLIYDNATVPMPLVMPTEYNYGEDFGPRTRPGIVKGSPMKDFPDKNNSVVKVGIDNVGSLGSSSLVVDAPTSWLEDESGTAQLKPGMRYVASSATGSYVGEGVIRRVTTYTTEGGTVTIDISHDMASQAPTVTDSLDVVLEPQTEGGILAVARTGVGFGGGGV